MSAAKEQYDAIVIGGGPAGSTAATLIAQQGFDVLLLDREKFPRFRIGESLMPATYWTLERLGALDKMHASNFVKKYSVQFVTGSGKESAPFYFHEFDDHPSSQTWQVNRADFDKMLVDNGVEQGVELHEEANVRDVLMQGEAAKGVDVEFADGTRKTIHSKVLVDASGQSSIISRRFGLKQVDPKLQHIAYFTHYNGARREQGIDEGATLVLATGSGKTWFWYIPLPDDVVSVGVVGPTNYLKSLGNDPAAIYDASLADCPGLQERLAHATAEREVRALRDFSYISNRIAGEGWILAGDAFGFLDPIYSTGVFLAMKSGEFAADAAVDGLKHGDTSATRLGQFGAQYVAGMEAMRKLVYAYYDENFSIPKFVKQHPHCRQHIVNLLVGNVFRVPTGDLFELMGQFIDLPEARALAPLEQAS